jgi:uncharacterized repeat protein (TIGR03806 family)
MAFATCGEDGEAGGRGGTAVADAAAAADAPGARGPAAPATGLDERPRNATCVAPRTPAEMPASLRATGCFDPAQLRRPAPGLIPYDVRAPLWSDGAAKERFLALPDGGRIAIGPDGDLDLPAGSVLVKTFLLDGAAIETRLFVRHGDGAWAGYSYEWARDGADARLVGDEGRNRLLGELEWYFPSRKHCLDCHTEAAGFTLGLELAQLDRELAYPGGRRANQIATWAHVGLFAREPPPPGARAPLADPADEGAPLEARARAYLHANCANCHRPGGVKEMVTLDLRRELPVGEMRACDAEPHKGDFGVSGARLLAPGAPERSMLSVRMRSLVGNVRMPPVASSVADERGVKLVDDWIRSMKECH